MTNLEGSMLTMQARALFYLAITATLVFSSHPIAEPAEIIEAQIREGSRVALEYTLSDETGSVIESNKGKQPMSYIPGKGQIIPGLEKELSGMKVGEEKKIQVKPEDGYGPVNPEAFQEVPKDKLPPEALKVGTMLMAQGPQGQGIPARVHEVKDTTVIMDFNHPMAGKTLSFDIKVSEVQSAEK
jgi:FKBP-type peptidyl-prolyl cis-trans isomerase SlyD